MNKTGQMWRMCTSFGEKVKTLKADGSHNSEKMLGYRLLYVMVYCLEYYKEVVMDEDKYNNMKLLLPIGIFSSGCMAYGTNN